MSDELILVLRPRKPLCGGSRARAFALTGDFMQTDPDCNYVPESGMERQPKNV